MILNEILLLNIKKFSRLNYFFEGPYSCSLQKNVNTKNKNLILISKFAQSFHKKRESFNAVERNACTVIVKEEEKKKYYHEIKV